MINKFFAILLTVALVIAIVYGWISLIAFLLCVGFSTMGVTLPMSGMRMIVLALMLLTGISVPKTK